MRIFSSTASSGCLARLVRYASSHVSITRANASCMLLHVRHDDEPVLAEPVAHVAGEAVEHRVAVDQQRDALVAGRLDQSRRAC